MQCQACTQNQCVPFLSLGHQPPSDAFLKKEDLQKPEMTYPLDVFFCPSCSLVQLGYSVEPDILFRDYVYMTGTNKRLEQSFSELVGQVIERYKPSAGDLMLDIGSNDGTLLKNYLPHKMRILGVDPSSVGQEAENNGIPTVIDYFNVETAKRIVEEHGKAKIITATNVFAHVRELDSFMEGVALLADKNGVFISESGYIVDMVEKMEYDTIYHEHLRYYSVSSLAKLFERFGFEIIAVEGTTGSSGGSIRVHAARKGNFSPDIAVGKYLEKEKTAGFLELSTYQKFAERIVEIKLNLLEILYALKKDGKEIAGIGAPAKGNTLLNYCKIDPTVVSYLVEKSKLKIGLYSPGMHIPVVDESRLLDNQPDAALLLAWNYADIIIPKLKGLGYKGRFIIPNPAPRIV